MTTKAEAKCLPLLGMEFPSCFFVSLVVEEFTTKAAKAQERTKLPKDPQTFWIVSPPRFGYFQALGTNSSCGTHSSACGGELGCVALNFLDRFDNLVHVRFAAEQRRLRNPDCLPGGSLSTRE